MPAISNLGTIFPGGVSSFDLAPAGKGFGRGDSGSAKRFRGAGVMSAPFVLAGLFSADVAAAVLGPSPFCWACWAHTGKANRALTATAAHQLRMILLPQLFVSDPKSLLSPLLRRLWPCYKLAWTHCGKLSAISRPTADTFPLRFPNTGRNCKRSQDAVPLAYSRFPFIRQSFLLRATCLK